MRWLQLDPVSFSLVQPDASNTTEQQTIGQHPLSHLASRADDPAVTLCNGTVYTHADLHHAAHVLAADLKVAPAGAFGLVADRSFEMVVGVLASALSLRTYAPIASDVPASRAT
jgi:hypothetical protein